jgi:hypothetical protein
MCSPGAHIAAFCSGVNDDVMFPWAWAILTSNTNDGGRIAINPDRFDKLITASRTAVDNDGTLDKEATSYNHIFDAFRLALKFYHFTESNDY